MLYAITPKVNESASNLKTIMWDHLKLYDFYTTHKLFAYSFDLKAGATFFGIGPVGCTYNCVHCYMKSSDFNNDKELKGGCLRTAGETKKYASDYVIAAEKSTAKQKLSSADYYSCETQPVDKNMPDNMKILYAYPPPPLHCSSGPFNDLFDALDATLKAYKSTMKATFWSDALYLTRTGHYGGKAVFKGRECRKLIENRDILKTLLKQHNSDSYCEPFVACFDAFYCVFQSCLGMVQYPRYPGDIRAFANSFFKVKEHANQINTLKNPPVKVHVSVTLKAHEIFVHVKQYLEHTRWN